jgi:RHS repeat-associated protein
LKEAAACRTEGHGREWTISALCYGSTWSGSGTIPTDKKFTGQRLDSATGIYYYGARFYDPEIGRFISADAIVPDLANPQSLNRYTYVLNNPLKYIDPTGMQEEGRFAEETAYLNNEGITYEEYIAAYEAWVRSGAPEPPPGPSGPSTGQPPAAGPKPPTPGVENDGGGNFE